MNDFQIQRMSFCIPFVALHCPCVRDLSFYEVLHFLDWLGLSTIAWIKLAVRNLLEY